MAKKKNVESTVREIRRKTRKKYSAEEKIRIVLEGLRGNDIEHRRNHAMLASNEIRIRLGALKCVKLTRIIFQSSAN